MDFFYEVFPTATVHMVIMEELSAAKQDKANRSPKAVLKKTKQDKVIKFVKTG